MLGAIIGDIAGSRFEFVNDFKRDKNFEFFTKSCKTTDDSYMTCAVAKALVLAKGDKDSLGKITVDCMRSVANDHPRTGWGARFSKWLFIDEDPKPYNSCGNGAGMRISPVGWVADSEEEVIQLSRIVTEVSHNHPEGIKGAEAVAVAVYMARTGRNKSEIREKLKSYYPRLGKEDFTIENLRGNYGYDEFGNWVTCQGSVPQALIAFLDATDFEDAVRNAVCIGGDSDTIGAMAGSIAEAYFGIPDDIVKTAMTYLSEDLKEIYSEFCAIKKQRIKRE